MTVTFGCLVLVAIIILILLIVLYKKKRKEYRDFLKHKQRKIKGDYKKYEYLQEDDDQNWPQSPPSSKNQLKP
jgi:F0F1-type ATP synthase membrane subunit b/b'